MSASNEAELLVSRMLQPAVDGQRYAIYDRLREIAPVHQTSNALLSGWYIISGYANCKAVLTAKETMNNEHVLRLMNVEGDGAYSRMNRTWMEYQNVMADHDRIRRLFFSHFTPRAVEAHRQKVRELVTMLLDSLAGRESFDVISEFAFPLPSMVIASLLGIPLTDMARFQEMMDQYLEATAMVKALDEETKARRDAISEELIEFFRGYLDERRRNPTGDLISKLGEASPAAGVSDEELLAQFVFVLIAGHSTTADMIGNAMVGLEKHPGQIALLNNGTVPMKDAIPEFLRYDSSLEVGTRYFNESMNVGGIKIAAGSCALLLLHSAHRDPAMFVEPDRLDLTRKAALQAFPFGGGHYFCLGSGLAKIELEEALGALVKRYPKFRILDLAWQGGLVSHGPSRLIIEGTGAVS